MQDILNGCIKQPFLVLNLNAVHQLYAVVENVIVIPSNVFITHYESKVHIKFRTFINSIIDSFYEDDPLSMDFTVDER